MDRMMTAGVRRTLGLAGVMLTLGTACGGEDQPESAPTAIVIDGASALPSLDESISVDDAPLQITVRIDAYHPNDNLRTAFYWDYGTSDQMLLDDRSYPATGERLIEVALPRGPVSSGCHELTLLALYDSNWNDPTDSPKADLSSSELAELSWTAAVGFDDNGEPFVCQ
jgi:hypothetical protein